MYFGDTRTCILKNAVVTVWYNKAVLFVSLVLFPVIHHLCGLTWGWNLGSYFERWSKYKELNCIKNSNNDFIYYKYNSEYKVVKVYTINVIPFSMFLSRFKNFLLQVRSIVKEVLDKQIERACDPKEPNSKSLNFLNHVQEQASVWTEGMASFYLQRLPFWFKEFKGRRHDFRWKFYQYV